MRVEYTTKVSDQEPSDPFKNNLKYKFFAYVQNDGAIQEIGLMRKLLKTSFDCFNDDI